MRATRDSTFADERRSKADLQRELAELRRTLDERTAERDEALHERDEALEQQTATAEVLGIINSSPGDLARVFEAMLEKALRLCEAGFGSLMSYDGNVFSLVALRNLPSEYFRLGAQRRAQEGSLLYRLIDGENIIGNRGHCGIDAAQLSRRTRGANRSRSPLDAVGRAAQGKQARWRDQYLSHRSPVLHR